MTNHITDGLFTSLEFFTLLSNQSLLVYTVLSLVTSQCNRNDDRLSLTLHVKNTFAMFPIVYEFAVKDVVNFNGET